MEADAKAGSDGVAAVTKRCRRLANRIVLCGNHRIVKNYMKKGRSSYNNPKGATLPTPVVDLSSLQNPETLHVSFDDLQSAK